MHIDSLQYFNGLWNVVEDGIKCKEDSQIVFIFGDTDAIEDGLALNAIKVIYPNAHIVGASTAGNIQGSSISEAVVVAQAIQFEKSSVRVAWIEYETMEEIEREVESVEKVIPEEGLKHLLIFSEGLNVNGSKVVSLANKIFPHVPKTGGLAGDGTRFHKTFVVADGKPRSNCVVFVGLYGDDLSIGIGCFGGWNEFGIDRVITKSKENVLFEIDNQPALKLYKKYLGDYANELPASALRFPLSIREVNEHDGVIRTILGVNEEEQSITFAGDVPEGYLAKLMRPNTDALIGAAQEAAKLATRKNFSKGIAIAVSCVGRKIVLGAMVDEELSTICDTLGCEVKVTGFYSYGEVAPFQTDLLRCSLHNQTMTLTVIYEK